MGKFTFAVLFILPCIASGQWGVSYHQSDLPFAGVNYQINNKFRAELRIGTDQYIDVLSVEGVVTYDLVKKEDYEFYAGLGIRTNDYAGFLIPVGLNIYPLPDKHFGFHMEVAPIIAEDNLLRGSWGIRYLFGKR